MGKADSDGYCDGDDGGDECDKGGGVMVMVVGNELWRVSKNQYKK